MDYNQVGCTHREESIKSATIRKTSQVHRTKIVRYSKKGKHLVLHACETPLVPVDIGFSDVRLQHMEA